MSLVRLTPVPHKKVWGSRHLQPWFPNPEEPVGEFWFEGVKNSPLLIKFLFTSQKLSVQVHPDDEYARRHHGSRGKTEMWHVLRAEPGAKIAAGFRTAIQPEELAAAARSGEILDLLNWVEAREGDTFFIPAGTVHAIGEGLALCEIQQNSDLTYRLYDYGRPRELHLERAAEVSHLGPHAARPMIEGNTLVSCEYFSTEKIRIAGTGVHRRGRDRKAWWIVLDGAVEIGGQRGRPGDVFYAPEGEGELTLSGDAVLLRTHAPA